MNYSEEIIEAYCLNQLNADDRAAFETELRGNTVLQEEVAKTRLALAAVDQLIKSDIERLFFQSKKNEPTISSEKQPTRIVSLNQYKRYFAVAASLLLIVSVFSWAMLDTSHNRMVNTAIHKVDIINPSTRSSSNELSTMDKGLDAYFNQKNYQKAVEYFESSDNEDANFYLGMSLLQSGDYQKADDVLSKILNDSWFPNHLTTTEDVAWYVILSKIGAKRYNSSRDAIQDIDNYLKSPSARYQQEAMKLKKQLENPLYNLRTKY